MKRNVTLILFLILLQACEKDDFFVDHTPYQIIIVAGQSNTHFGIGYDSILDSSQPGIYQLGRFGENDYQIVPAIEPLDHHTRDKDKIGFALGFAKRMLAEDSLGQNILIVPCGHGGTGFIDNRWNKGDDLYMDLVARVQHIKNHYPKSHIKAILWHQGERDVNNPKFQNQFDLFVKDLRNDLDTDSVPFVLGGMVPYWVRWKDERLALQKILKETKSRLPLVGYVDPESPFVIEKLNNSIDLIHYDASGQRELAERYYNVFKTLDN